MLYKGKTVTESWRKADRQPDDKFVAFWYLQSSERWRENNIKEYEKKPKTFTSSKNRLFVNCSKIILNKNNVNQTCYEDERGICGLTRPSVRITDFPKICKIGPHGISIPCMNCGVLNIIEENMSYLQRKRLLIKLKYI